MSRSRKKSLRKQMKPVFYVFCEGETEKVYVNLLRSHYRIPIEIKSKISGNRISQKHIDSFLRDKPRSQRDKIFLLYDLDVAEVTDKLHTIKNTILLVSNPCIEIWFALHFQDQSAHCSSKKCFSILLSHWRNYQKGKLLKSHQKDLLAKQEGAIVRARKMKILKNPSSTVFYLIEELRNIKEMN